MEYTKKPLSVQEQITILQRRGLIISDTIQATRHLKLISYFRLANYWKPMEADKINHDFKAGSSFENALSLYYFDKELRALVFTAIQSCEIAFRTQMIHHVSMAYGAFWFADSKIVKSQSLYHANIQTVEKELGRTKEDFIKEHYEKYTLPAYPPAWKTLEVLSFGTVSKLYSNLNDNKLKKQIARSFLLPQHLYLESWIKTLAILRNYCAHHARLWNRLIPIPPQIPKSLPESWIDNQKINPYKLYATLCCLQYLLNTIYPDNGFGEQLRAVLSKYPNVDTRAMGFPVKWDAEIIWK